MPLCKDNTKRADRWQRVNRPEKNKGPWNDQEPLLTYNKVPKCPGIAVSGEVGMLFVIGNECMGIKQ